jgi:hypothetical protein
MTEGPMRSVFDITKNGLLAVIGGSFCYCGCYCIMREYRVVNYQLVK